MLDEPLKTTFGKALNLSAFSGVIFDLDGTLVDSVPDLALALNHALAQLSLPSVTEAQVRLWVGNGSRKLVERSLDAHNLNKDAHLESLHRAFLTSYKQFLCADSKLYDGVKETLTGLSDKGIALGLVTNKPIAFVPELLKALNIEHFFQVIVGGDSLPEKKPSPLPLIHVASALGLATEKCLMVGDSRSDVVSAQGANMPCVLLEQGYNQGQDLRVLHADWLLADVRELQATLKL